MKIGNKAEYILSLPPVEWEAAFDKMTETQRGQAVDQLADLAQAAAQAHGYAEARYGAGCSDQGHAVGVKWANKHLRGVRKVLGFTYPNAPVSF